MGTKPCVLPWVWALVMAVDASRLAGQDEPPAINPFGPRKTAREDAVPGYVEMSDGKIIPGSVYLTRDMRLKLYDAAVERQREIPLRVVRRIEARVVKQWMEREWRFKENANDQKVYTGRSYPARLYEYAITLADGRTLQGPLSAILYVRARGEDQRPQRVLLHKRDKGPVDTNLESLQYVRAIELGQEAMERGLRLAAERRSRSASDTPDSRERRKKDRLE